MAVRKGKMVELICLLLIRIITIIRSLVNVARTVRISEEGGNSMNQILERMRNLNIKQVDMMVELRKRGITVQPPEISSILKGVLTTPKAMRVLKECENILNEYECNTV
jgi:hypothetical protein